MNMLFNFKDFHMKGVPYEDFNLSQIKVALQGYSNIINNYDKLKVNISKEEIESHYDYLLNMYQGDIITKIDNLSETYNLDFGQNLKAFDYIFKQREQNKENLSFLDILVPLEEEKSPNTLKKQLYLDNVITELINNIKKDCTSYINLSKKMQA